ncbi:MAG TPA: hypothetical protein VJN64_06860 [Terriglobales bacterium]|nr:hypothetical protein [Terriglobales bacterium]
MVAFPSRPYRRMNPYSSRLVESYCPACELLIAASPSRKVLEVMENLHECPVHFRYPPRGVQEDQRAAKQGNG